MISYLPTFMPTKILIIGGGGTGSRLVPYLAQFLKTCAWIPNPEITLVDDDIVEEKNLQRQNFIQRDVGKHKAMVLAERYSKAFNIPITPVLKRIVKPRLVYDEKDPEYTLLQEQFNLFSRHATNSIVVMCVDSPEARRYIVGGLLQATGQTSAASTLLIDSGNENDFGQVSLSTARIMDYRNELSTLEAWGNSVAGDLQIPLIPLDIDYYQNMKAETTLSCADLDQTMAINTMMAVTMFGIIQNFYYARPISFHRLNVSLSHGITPEYINPRFLIRNGTASYPKRVDRSFADIEMYIPHVRVEAELRTFHTQQVMPLKRQIAAAEKIQREATEKAEKERLETIKKAAVEEAMVTYGWKLPKAAEEQLPPDQKQLQELIKADLEERLRMDKATAAISPKAAVKKVKRAEIEDLYWK